MTRKTIKEVKREVKKLSDDANTKTSKQETTSSETKRVMSQLERLRSTGFRDTDQRVTTGVERVGESAVRAVDTDAQKVENSAQNLDSHSNKYEQVGHQARSEALKAANVKPQDSRISSASEIEAAAKDASVTAEKVTEKDRQAATSSRERSKKATYKAIKAAKKRPRLGR